MKSIIRALSLLLVSSSAALGAPKSAAKLDLSVKMPPGVRAVYAIAANGAVFAPSIKGTVASLSIPGLSVPGASLYAVSTSGQTIGPVFAQYGAKSRLFFAKTKSTGGKKANKPVVLVVRAAKDGQSYLLLASSPKGDVFDKKYQYRASLTPALGLNVAKASRCVPGKLAAADLDCDGVVNALDADVNGNGISNIVEGRGSRSPAVIRASENGGGNGGGNRDGQGRQEQSDISVPFTTLYLSMGQSVNWHLTGAINPTSIDAIIGGENQFAIAFFFSPRSGSGAVTGGHVVCDTSLVYCRPTVGADTGTAIYSGFMEGDRSLVGRRWSDIRTDGSEYSLEAFNVGQNTAVAASIQPRVGTAAFRAGDNYRVDFTNAAGAVVESTTLTLPPYFVTVPAIRSFNTASSDAGSDTLVAYGDGNALGSSSSNPIVLASTGEFAGKLRLSVWRLQRQAVGGETAAAAYFDYGHLNYGVVINNNSGEYTCGGLYESLSSTLTEASSQGRGGSYLTRDGATIWPLVDSADDYAPSAATDPATIRSNTIEFSVNLSACLARNGLGSGVHQVTLMAAGGDTGHGSNRAAQTFYVSFP